MKKYKSVRELCVINHEIECRILEDLKKNDILYICAPIGWGKYTLLSSLYDKLEGKAVWLEETEDSILEKQLAELPRHSGRRIIIIPRLEKLAQNGKMEMIAKFLSEKRREDVFLIASEIPFPEELLPYTLYYKMRVYGIEELRPTRKEVGEYFRKDGLKLDEETLKQIEKDLDNMPLCLLMLENLLSNSNKKYSALLKEQCMEDVYSYMDVMLFRNFKVEEQEKILKLSCLQEFSETEAADMLDISQKEVKEFIQRLFVRGSVLLACRSGWQFEPLFGRYLNRVKYKYLDMEDVRHMYRKALGLAERQEDWKECLRYAYILDEEEPVAEYLEKCLLGDVDFEAFLELSVYFEYLSPHSYLGHPVLIITRAILESVNGNPKRAEECEQGFIRYIGRMQESEEKEMLERLLIYRQLIRMETADLKQLTELFTEIRKRPDRAEAWSAKDFQITLPSVLHGEKDYCDILVQEKSGTEVFEQLKQLTEGILDNSFYVIYSLAEAEVLYEQNHLEQAVNMMSKVIWESGANHNQRLKQASMVVVADLMVAKNQLDNMDDFIAQKVKVTDSGGLFADNVAAHQVYYYLLGNNEEKIMQWMEEKSPDWNFTTIHAYQYLMKAKVYIWMENYSLASLLLQRLLTVCVNCGMQYMRMKVEILQAVINYREGDEHWMPHLLCALEYAEKLHFVRVLADEGAAVYELLQELAHKDRVWAQKSYFKEVLTAVRAHMLQYPGYLKRQTVINIGDFSSYEKDIMRLLVNGDKNAVIAGKLFVSENTVKYHLKNIYQKLEVNSRSQAANKIKEYNLL